MKIHIKFNQQMVCFLLITSVIMKILNKIFIYSILISLILTFSVSANAKNQKKDIMKAIQSSSIYALAKNIYSGVYFVQSDADEKYKVNLTVSHQGLKFSIHF